MKTRVMKAISITMTIMLIICMTSITTFAAGSGVYVDDPRVNAFTKKYSMSGFELSYPDIGISDSTLEATMDSLEKAFGYLGVDFTKNLLKYSSGKEIHVSIAENEMQYGGYDKGSAQEKSMDRSTIVRETEDGVFFEIPVVPSFGIWAQKSYCPMTGGLIVNPNRNITPKEIITGMGELFFDSTHRNAAGNTNSVPRQWYDDKYCGGLDTKNDEAFGISWSYLVTYNEIYTTVFTRGVMNGADKPCSKNDQYTFTEDESVGGRTLPYSEYLIATGIYNDLVKYVGPNCTATQRMAGYLGIDVSKNLTGNNIESADVSPAVDVASIQAKFNKWYTNDLIVVSTKRTATTVTSTVKNPVFYSYNATENKIAKLDIKSTAKDGKITFTSPGGAIIISEGMFVKK